MSGIYEMREKEKTKDQIIKELVETHRKIFKEIETKHKRIEEAIKCRLKFEKTVSTILSRFVGVYDIDYAINASLADVGKLCNANRAYLFLFNDNKTTMSNTHEWCAKGINPQIENLKNISSDMFHWWMKKLLNGEVIHIKDVSKLPVEARVEKEILKGQDIKSLLVFSLSIGGELAGFMGFDNVIRTGKWSNEDIKILSIISKILGNSFKSKRVEKELKRVRDELELKVKERTAELTAVNEKLQRDITERKWAEEKLKQSYRKLKKTIDNTINIIAKIVETRDPYTAGHQQRVSLLATAIAKEIGIPEDKVEGIKVASLIHDIGKINIPAEILSKPGKLTEEEFNLIKSHPKIGCDILKLIDFSWPVAEIILQHHENINGSGYPRGLKDDEILFEAKIICVADVVEAMSSHRPYRPALGIDKALEEISKNRGILYDPEAVDVCIKLFREKDFKF
jgi:putative nucleotidyltransferase with HDIG domain